ncbi:MAG: Ppx/GppA family phosphatase [Ignavibacteria bacterium]|nr:Ppx/GppA family phosphatase [Ignavibacteria bacterium]
MEKTLAAIDIGTNSFHLIVVEIKNNSGFKILAREKEVVRLGKSSRDMKYIFPDATTRAISTLKRFKLICESYNAKIRAVATSAVREALNSEDFVNEIYDKTGIKIEVVSGYEEARLIYLGVLQALPVFDRKILLIDIGGGSTEFLIGEKSEVLFANSLKIGAVRLTERFFEKGKFNPDLIDEARLSIKTMIYPVLRDLRKYQFDIAIGSSGTILNIGSIIRNYENDDESSFNLNSFSYGKESLLKVVKKITNCSNTDQLYKIKGIDPERVDIITAGALILEQIFLGLNLEKITISTYALREGIVLDTIDKISGEKILSFITDVRYKSVIRFAEHCNYDKKHSEKVTELASKIFDFTKENFKEYNLSDSDKEYLVAACILHDVGHNISPSQHHRHSYYLIKNSDLLGFNNEEIEIIANISRYHRKSHPKLKHENFAKLSSVNKDRVRKLAAILRIADGLDRSHNSLVDDLQFERKNNTINITLISKSRELDLELWGANMRKDLYEQIFDIKLNFLV